MVLKIKSRDAIRNTGAKSGAANVFAASHGAIVKKYDTHHNSRYYSKEICEPHDSSSSFWITYDIAVLYILWLLFPNLILQMLKKGSLCCLSFLIDRNQIYPIT